MSIRSAIKLSCACLMLLICSGISAAGLHQGFAKHYINLNLSGAEANNLGFTQAVKNQAGGAADLGIGYEVHIHQIYLGLGVTAHFQYLRDYMANYMEEYNRVDFEGEAVRYGYVFENYQQNTMAMKMAIPIYIGAQFGEYVYCQVGASINMPVWNNYSVKTDMLTQGIYDWSIEPARTVGMNDFSPYGYYANKEYNYNGRYTDLMSVHANAEIGSYIPLKENITKLRLRIGAYCSYGWRMGEKGKHNLLNLEKVDLDPATQNEKNLTQTIQFNHLNTTIIYGSLPQNLEVGVRLTLLFNVNATPHHCLCLDN